MSLVSELAARPGVLAAGEYSYRGDRFTCQGQLDDAQARMASMMCRATTLGVHMQADILGGVCEQCGLVPARGWIVRGPRYTVCVVANVFCFLEGRSGSVNEIVALMRDRLSVETDVL
ncbi:MAG: DUF2173 family protein, partial [Gammaproteobacteria bacterium]|nr:DUF2173 family protein [Gammaproteobacteria bacterium]